MPEITGIDHVALTVIDLAASITFYEAVLGASVMGTMDDGPFRRAVLALPGPTHLGLTQHDTGSGRPFDPTNPGLDHVGFACASRHELLAWGEHLDALRVRHSDVQDAAYGSALSFSDPDGNALEFFAPAP
ncbi:VOC family protein [Agrococcus sp. Ld7]|uniref:VOC family protein n=1 Tax=Agrococcus sp. Ld7 TaxID=649148 RepID=UPI00386F4B21